MVRNPPAILWIGKIHWRRAWKPTPAFLPGKYPWAEEPGGSSPWDRKESDMTEQLSTAHQTASVTRKQCAQLFKNLDFGIRLHQFES